MSPGETGTTRVPITINHIVRPAGRPSPKTGEPLPGQDYVVLNRAAWRPQMLCIGKEEWAALRAQIDEAFS